MFTYAACLENVLDVLEVLDIFRGCGTRTVGRDKDTVALGNYNLFLPSPGMILTVTVETHPEQEQIQDSSTGGHQHTTYQIFRKTA